LKCNSVAAVVIGKSLNVSMEHHMCNSKLNMEFVKGLLLSGKFGVSKDINCIHA